MTEPEHEPEQDAEHAADAAAAVDRGDAPPASNATWVADHEPPGSEAERQVLETVRSVSRLEESN